MTNNYNPVDKTDFVFILSCFVLALVCFLATLLLHGPGIVATMLFVIMTIAIGTGSLRLMHVIRDL